MRNPASSDVATRVPFLNVTLLFIKSWKPLYSVPVDPTPVPLKSYVKPAKSIVRPVANLP